MLVYACRPAGLRKDLGSGRGDFPRGQVDDRPGIAQIPGAHPVGQVNHAVDPRVVLDGELAELGVDRELVTELLVKRLGLLAALPRQRLGLLEFLVRERGAQVLGGFQIDDPARSQIDGREDGDVVEIAVRSDQGQRPAYRGRRFRRGFLALAGFRSCSAGDLPLGGSVFAFGGAVWDGLSGSLAVSSSTPTTYSRRSASGLAAALGLLAKLDQALAGDVNGLFGLLRGQTRARAGRPLRSGPGSDPDHPQRRGDQCGHSWSADSCSPSWYRECRSAPSESLGGTDGDSLGWRRLRAP